MKPILFLLIMLPAVLHCGAQVAKAPALPSKNNYRSQKTFRPIDSLLTTAVDSNWLVGAVGFIQQNGKVVYDKAFGFANKAENRPMKTDDIFRIASQTKAITSVAAMMLYDEGKLSLTDPVSKYIPGFAHETVLNTFTAADSSYTTVPANREITIHDLLTHTSGIDYAIIGSPEMQAIYAKAGLHPGFGDDTMQLNNMVNLLATLPLVHQPGEKFTYGLNVDVLGRIVEIVSGQRLDEFFASRIFKPLGMNDTYFYLPAAKQSRLVKVYTVDSANQTVEWNSPIHNLLPNYPFLKGTYFAGGAGLSSTVADYARFLQMLLNGGIYNGHKLLKPSTVKLMTSNQIGNLEVGNKDKFGLGFEITTAANERETNVSAGSFAWGGYFGTVYWADPKRNLIGELFVQQSPIQKEGITGKFKQVIYQK